MNKLWRVCRDCGEVVAAGTVCDECGETAWDPDELDSRINDEAACGDRLRM